MLLFYLFRGGARGGLGGYNPPSEHASPRRKVKSDFFGDFWPLQYPENHIFVASSEESAPLRKIPGASPDLFPLVNFARTK